MSKMYSFIERDNKGNKKAEEIKKNIVRNMSRKEYENIIKTNKKKNETQNGKNAK